MADVQPIRNPEIKYTQVGIVYSYWHAFVVCIYKIKVYIESTTSTVRLPQILCHSLGVCL